MTDGCPKCGEPVEGGEWHRRCALVAVAALLAAAPAPPPAPPTPPRRRG